MRLTAVGSPGQQIGELRAIDLRTVLRGAFMSNLLSNVRYALRQFRLSPIFTVAAVLTLALGIGGTTAIFTLIHAVMLRSLPVADPESLYRIGDGETAASRADRRIAGACSPSRSSSASRLTRPNSNS